MKSCNEIRQLFLNYFKNKQHEMVPSSPLVPANDPSLLFTNAGMVQFKDKFLGHEVITYTRATTAQRCVRAGGKHNDLENVGHTARHHTFFEMLGNFSFGDYFKEDAIRFAWEFLTEVLKLPKEKLWITVFESDDESADIWIKKIGVDPQRFSRCGEKDNFWSMGDTGPCGPCTEIFYDHGPEIAGGPPGSPDADGDRYIEIWNLVFMQYNRSTDGALTPLPKPSVDTGMGLERLAAVLQGVHNNYDIDLFKNLIQKIAHITRCNNLQETSLRVLADHIRSASFLITDGVIPSNEGRGYVLRRIIRRALRHGHKLGMNDPFFYQCVAPLVKEMGQAYPELTIAQANVECVLLQEEQQFARTLDQGLKLLEQAFKNLKDNYLPGVTIFQLYDTYGFPVDLTADIAREKGIELDMESFELEMARQRQLSKEHSKFAAVEPSNIQVEGRTTFIGYETQHHEAAQILALIRQEKNVDCIQTGDEAIIILDHTPFYAEAGGQIGDRGWIKQGDAIFEVHDTQKRGHHHLHYGKMIQGILHTHEHVVAIIDEARRQSTRFNHSATHLLFAALRSILGTHVIQKGSLVEPERLRFDFTHSEALNRDTLQVIERWVNDAIRANYSVDTQIMTVDDAKKSGAIALFGEKYGEKVRVLSMGEISREFCGGTHVSRTGDIGLFKILNESGIAAGVRRIEAITGQYAIEWMQLMERQMLQTAQQLKAPVSEITDRVKQLLMQKQEAESIIGQLKAKLAQGMLQDVLEQVIRVNNIPVLVTQLNHLDMQSLQHLFNQAKGRIGVGVMLFTLVHDERIAILASVDSSLTQRIKANELLQHVAKLVDGKGGGRPDMAQGSGTAIDKLEIACAEAKQWIEKKLTA